MLAERLQLREGEVIGPAQAVADAPGRAHRRLQAASTAQQDQELVAAESPEHIVGSHRAAQPAGRLDQQLVACGVAVGVVDLLEAVEVHVDDARRSGVLQPRGPAFL